MKMLPSFSGQNAPHLNRAYAPYFRGNATQCKTSVPQMKHSTHSSRCNFAHPIRNPFGLTILCDFILHVIGVRAQEQMLWIYARWVVATMQDIKAFWDCAKVEFIRNAVRPETLFAAVQNAVAKMRFLGSPQPTRSCIYAFRDFGPKPFLNALLYEATCSLVIFIHANYYTFSVGLCRGKN